MTEEEHKQRFYEGVEFADKPWLRERADILFEQLKNIESCTNVKTIFKLFQE